MKTDKLPLKLPIIGKSVFLLFILLCAVDVGAQVTIGSGIPPVRGALLDIKEKEPDNENITAETGGLLLPRVGLKSKSTLIPFIANDADFQNNTDNVKDKHIGLIVYNVTIDFAEDLCPGTYEWTGNVWERLSEGCSFFEFICSTLETNQYIKNDHTVFSESNSIQYNSSVQKDMPTPVTHSYGNGLSITIPQQNIATTTNGTLNFIVSGDGTTPGGLYSLSLSELSAELGFEISSTCMIAVIISAPQINLLCDIASATAEIGVHMNKVVQVVATLDRVPYTLPVGNIGQPAGGITPSIETPQILTSLSGNVIDVTLKGIPLNAGKIKVPITIGNATCNIDVNVSAPFEITCSDIYSTGFVDQDLSETTSPVYVPYTLNSGTYTMPAGVIGTHYGVTAYVDEQTLTAPSGTIEVKFRGTPIQTLDKIPFEIELQGNTCFIHLSVINPPTICPDGKVAKAFVFYQNNKWYIVTGKGSYDISGTESASVAATIECNTEEEALRHPDALQYCGDVRTARCIKLFDRRGAYVTNLDMTQRSAEWYNNTGILEARNGCITDIIAYSGARMRSVSFKAGYLGAVGLSGGIGYLGITAQEAKLTDKPLR